MRLRYNCQSPNTLHKTPENPITNLAKYVYIYADNIQKTNCKTSK